MKKIIRLTESDLVRLVKRVINEEVTGYTEKEIESLDMFLSYINPKGKQRYWKQESVPSSTVVTLPSNARITNIGSFDIKKPLNWVMYDNNKLIDGTQFQIYKSKGKLYYRYLLPDGDYGKDQEFIGNEKSALTTFNRAVRNY